MVFPFYLSSIPKLFFVRARTLTVAYLVVSFCVPHYFSCRLIVGTMLWTHAFGQQTGFARIVLSFPPPSPHSPLLLSLFHPSLLFSSSLSHSHTLYTHTFTYQIFDLYLSLLAVGGCLWCFSIVFCCCYRCCYCYKYVWIAYWSIRFVAWERWW